MRKINQGKIDCEKKKYKGFLPDSKIRILILLLIFLLVLSGFSSFLYFKENSLLKTQEIKYQEVIAIQKENIDKILGLNSEKEIRIKEISDNLVEIDKFITKISGFLKIKKPIVITSVVANNPKTRTYETTRSSIDLQSREQLGEMVVKSEKIISILKQYEEEAEKYNLIRARMPSIWPVYGIITSNFGKRFDPFNLSIISVHEGVDIASFYGAPIRATASGVVVQAGSEGDYGILCTINHENGYQTLYGHLNKIMVEAGDDIVKGQVIGYEGNTGRTTGAHLHYEIKLNRTSVDPRKYLPKF